MLDVDGVFVQIGLLPTTEWLDGVVGSTPHGEVVVDARGATGIPGVFAAGDCTTAPWKQIVAAAARVRAPRCRRSTTSSAPRRQHRARRPDAAHRSAAAAAQHPAEDVADDAPGVQATGGSSAATRWGRRGTRPSRRRGRHAACRRGSPGRRPRHPWSPAGWGRCRSAAERHRLRPGSHRRRQHRPAPAWPARTNHRREDGQQFLDERPAHARATHRGHLAEPVDDVLLAVAEDVVGDGLTVAIVDRGEAAPPLSRSSWCWPEGPEDRVGAGGVAGVARRPPSSAGSTAAAAARDVVGGGADLLGDGVGRKGAEDVVECGTRRSFLRRRNGSARLSST